MAKSDQNKFIDSLKKTLELANKLAEADTVVDDFVDPFEDFDPNLTVVTEQSKDVAAKLDLILKSDVKERLTARLDEAKKNKQDTSDAIVIAFEVLKLAKALAI